MKIDDRTFDILHEEADRNYRRAMEIDCKDFQLYYEAQLKVFKLLEEMAQ